MKQKINVFALVAGAIFLHGCGGSMLGTSDSDDYKLIPDVVTEDLAKPRPSANAAVIKTDGTKILAINNQEVLLRGINLQFGDDPLGRINGVEAIRETGSNVVRLVLRADTSPQNLEAALNKVIEHNLFAVLTLWEPEPVLACTDNEQALTNAVNNLWLDKWLPIIVQDRYQAHIMINIASGWGPKEVFNGFSFGYKTYIDNYKAVIRQFRRAGFKLPLVIDAPGCGSDYHAFVSGRAKELLAADAEKNLILSVHGYGNTWNSGDKVVAAIGQLQSQNIPVIMSEFGGSGLGENPVKHMAILEKGAGDYAIDIAVPWRSAADKAALFVPLDAPVDITNSEVSLDIHLDAAYIEDGTMGVQMYLRDTSDRYANLAWHAAEGFTANQWNTRKYTVKNHASFGWADPAFDITAVAKVGIELIANGKPAEVLGNVKIDNFKVIEGVAAVPAVTYSESFDTTTGGWVGTQWEGQPVGISVVDGALHLTPEAAGLEAGIRGLTSEGVDFSAPVTINARIFFPASLGNDFFFTFYALDGAWTTTDYLGPWAFQMGEWNDVSIVANFSEAGNSGIAIQMGGYPEAAWADAIQIDSIEIVSVPVEEASAVELGAQYQSGFDSDIDNWGSLSAWGGASADFEVEGGALKVTPKHPGSDGAEKVVIHHGNILAIEKLDFSQDPFTVKMRVQLPSSYAGTEYNLLVLFQDSTYNVDISRIWAAEELPTGEWVDLTWTVDFVADVTKGEGFNREALPRAFVIEVNGNQINDPILIDEIVIEGMVPVEKEETIISLVDFHYTRHFENFAVDYVEGELTVDDFAEAGSVYQRTAPFHWIAWSWFGNTAEFADWDLTMSVDNSEHLTPRGEEIVNGKGGIQEFVLVQEEVAE